MTKLKLLPSLAQLLNVFNPKKKKSKTSFSPPPPPSFLDKINTTPPPQTEKKVSPPPLKKHTLSTHTKKRKSSHRIDKHGFHILTDKNDLYRIFCAEEKKWESKFKSNDKRREKTSQEDFATLWKSFQSDRRQISMMDEKIKSESGADFNLSRSEKLRDYPSPQIEIDMHGFTAMEAETRIEGIIWNARYKGILTLRIITGKGLHSTRKAVLPDLVEAKLIYLKRRKWILDYRWEKGEKQKSGSIIVYLIPLR